MNVQNKQMSCAFFDLDGTMIEGFMIQSFPRFLADNEIVDSVRRALGRCPEAPEPIGFQKLVRLPVVFLPIFRARVVQVGLGIGFLIQTMTSLLSTIYFRPQIIAFFEMSLNSQETSPMEVSAAMFSLFPILIIMVGVPFVSSVISGYSVGKVSTKLRYGILLGITSVVLGLLSSYFIGYFYSFSYSFSEILTNTGNIALSEVSFTDIIIGC